MASTAASHFGASLSYTELGPPDKIIPAGSSLRISSSAVVHGNIALNTCCSRTRRAINWVYCPPKSSTTTPPCSVFIFPCSIPRPALCSVPCFIFAAPSIPSPHSPPAVSGAPPSFCEGGSWVLFSSSLPLFLSSSLPLFLSSSLLLFFSFFLCALCVVLRLSYRLRVPHPSRLLRRAGLGVLFSAFSSANLSARCASVHPAL